MKKVAQKQNEAPKLASCHQSPRFAFCPDTRSTVLTSKSKEINIPPPTLYQIVAQAIRSTCSTRSTLERNGTNTQDLTHEENKDDQAKERGDEGNEDDLGYIHI